VRTIWQPWVMICTAPFSSAPPARGPFCSAPPARGPRGAPAADGCASRGLPPRPLVLAEAPPSRTVALSADTGAVMAPALPLLAARPDSRRSSSAGSGGASAPPTAVFVASHVPAAAVAKTFHIFSRADAALIAVAEAPRGPPPTKQISLASRIKEDCNGTKKGLRLANARRAPSVAGVGAVTQRAPPRNATPAHTGPGHLLQKRGASPVPVVVPVALAGV
jgi:hypothetical protein